jgi:predicted Zn-dependent protease
MLLALNAVLIAGCAKNPVTGKNELALISESQEIAMGTEANPQILAEFGEVNDPALQAYFQDMGLRLAHISERPNLPWHFAVLDDSLVNAFALPGGYIYFTRGILAYMNNEAEMAGVLGHEIGHVTARHAVSQGSKAQLAELGLGLGSILSPTVAQFGGLAQTGLGLLFLKFSRGDEAQSDTLGVRYMYELGYDPRALSSFFQVFQQMQEENGGGMPSWLSSHPAPPDRVEKTRALAGELVASGRVKTLKIGQQRFLERIAGLVFGTNPREGFSQKGHFYHPDLKFQLSVPESWTTRNTKASVVFVHPEGGVGVQLSLAPGETTSPRARAEEVARQPGVSVLSGKETRINGIPAFAVQLQVSDRQGNQIRAMAAFLSFQNRVFELIGMGSPAEFDRRSRELESLITSFATLDDQEILRVQPDRLALYEVKRGGTLQDVARLFPNARVTAEDLALLNRVGLNQQLAAGTQVKVVKAGR